MKRPESYYANLIDGYKESGLNRKEFCKEKGITESHLAYALRHDSRKKEKERPCSFVKVETEEMVTFALGKKKVSVTMRMSDAVALLRRLL